MFFMVAAAVAAPPASALDLWAWWRTAPARQTLPAAAAAPAAAPAACESSTGLAEGAPRFVASSAASVAQLQAGWRLLQDLQTSQDPCLLRAFADLQIRCQALDQDERVQLAVQWLNCQRAATQFPLLACGPTDDADACLARMDKDDFTQYSMYFLKVGDVCAALANDVFRAQVRVGTGRGRLNT